MKVAVIGAGAAGIFSAIHIKENYSNAEVWVFEKSNKLLSKVLISGGGRCNVTHNAASIKDLVKGYPRGGQLLKKLFSEFSHRDMMQWLEKRNVPLKTESDGRVFPQSNNSRSIVDSFLIEIERLNVNIQKQSEINEIISKGVGYELYLKNGEIFFADKIVVAMGGVPKIEKLDWLKKLGHQIKYPVPSLFTFNIKDQKLHSLKGLSVQDSIIKLSGTKYINQGPVLITHWGLSGPCVLKLSAWAARHLAEKEYQQEIIINWLGQKNEEIIKTQFQTKIELNPKKNITNIEWEELPSRLWNYLLDKAHINSHKTCCELKKSEQNKLINLLSQDRYLMQSKTTFKEEFVTCGGISLESINPLTLESKTCKNLYFAGEVLDIDGITGGYNFQAAWTTAYIAAKLS